MWWIEVIFGIFGVVLDFVGWGLKIIENNLLVI